MPGSKDSHEDESEVPRVDEYEPDERAQVKGDDEVDEEEDVDEEDVVEDIDLDDLSAMEGPDA